MFYIGEGVNMKVAIIGYTPRGKGKECIHVLEEMGFFPNDIIVLCGDDTEGLSHLLSDFPHLPRVKHMVDLMWHKCDVAIVDMEETTCFSQVRDDLRAVEIHEVLFMEYPKSDEEDILRILADGEGCIHFATGASGVQTFIESNCSSV